jgi:hypothetical protein
LRILGEVVGQEFQSHEAVEASVLGFVDDSHAAAAEHLNNAVVRDGFADQIEPLGGGVVVAALPLDKNKTDSTLGAFADCAQSHGPYATASLHEKMPDRFHRETRRERKHRRWGRSKIPALQPTL